MIKSKFGFKQVLSFIMAMLLVLTTPSIAAFAGTGRPDDPYNVVDNFDKFPQYPEQGYVGVNKDARWVQDAGGDNVYAQVKISNDSIMTSEGADVVMVLDYSGSMGNGNSSGNSLCLNPNHYHDYIWRTTLNYQVFTDQTNNRYVSDTINGASDLVEVAVRIHTSDAGTNPIAVSYTISGMATEHNGYPVNFYRVHTLEKPSGSDWSGMFPISALNNQVYTDVRSMLALTFGGTKDVTNTQVFPTDPNHIGNYNRDGWFNYSFGCFFRIDITKSAAQNFLDEIYKDFTYRDAFGRTQTVPNKYRVSLVILKDEYTGAIKVDNGAFRTAAQRQLIVNGMNSNSVDGGTSYATALDAAREVIEARDSVSKSRPAYVLFMSDGYPEATDEYSAPDGTPSPKVQTAINRLHDVASVYSVGVGLTGASTLKTIQAVASTPAMNQNVADDANALTDLFKRIAREMVRGGKNAVVTDVVGKNWELVPNSAEHPWEINIEGQMLPASYVQEHTSMVGTDTVKWNVGNIPAVQHLTFYIKARLEANDPNRMLPGNEYDTNDSCEIVYQNEKDEWFKQDYDSPTLLYPGGSIRVVYYMTDSDGNAVSKNGTQLLTNDYNRIMSSAYRVQDYMIREGTSASLDLGKLYSATEGDYFDTAKGMQYRINIPVPSATGYAIRVYDLLTETYQNKPDGYWNLTLQHRANAYVILVGVRPEFAVTVYETKDGVTTPKTPEPKALGAAVSYLPTPPTNYSLLNSRLEVRDVDGNIVTGSSVSINGVGAVTGTMPYANVNIYYEYSQIDGVAYNVFYHKDVRTNAAYNQSSGAGAVGTRIPYNTTPPLGYVAPPELTDKNGNVLTDALQIQLPATLNEMHVTWTKRDSNVPYTIYYCAGDKANVITALTRNEVGTWGDPIDLKIAQNTPPGYSGAATVEPNDTLLIDAYNKVYYVVYNQTNDYKYRIEYYAEDLTPANMFDSKEDLGGFGANIPYDLNNAPHGYNTPGTLVAGSATTIGVVEPPAGNVAQVLFGYDDRKKDLPVTINYYTVGVNPANRFYTETVYGVYGTPVNVNWSAHVPNGYTGTPTIIKNSPRFTDPTFDLAPDNIVSVVWDENQRDEYTYHVQYFTKEINPNNMFHEVTDKAAFDSIIPVDTTIVPPGYNNLPVITGADKVTSNEALNYKYVVFPASARIPYNYKVTYYVDSVDPANIIPSAPGKMNPVTGISYINENIPIDLDAYCPAGYTKANAVISRDPATISDTLGNEITVVFMDKITDIPFEVRYYKDSRANEANYLGSEYGTGFINEDIVATGKLKADVHVPSGYKTPGAISGRTVLGISNNIAYVVYTEKLDDVPWRVEYYKDSLNTTPIETVQHTGVYGAYISDSMANLYFAVPTGYKTPGTRSGATVIGQAGLTEDDNVVKVLYDQKLTNIQCEVVYYKDSVDSANRLGNAYVYGTFGETIVVDRTMYCPTWEGYTTPGALTGSTTYAETGNQVNVVYTKGTYTVVVNYYKDFATLPADTTNPNFIATEDLPGLSLNDPITVDMWLHLPVGYAHSAQYYGPSIVQRNGNTVTIVYDMKANNIMATINYYVDSIDPDNLVGIDYAYGQYGAPIIASRTKYAPADYATPGARSGAATYNYVDNTVNILYPNKLNGQYTITFYQDSIYSTPVGTISGESPIGTDLQAMPEVITARTTSTPVGMIPLGYVGPGTWTGNTRIQAGQNNISVVFDTRATGIKYVVEYWKDAVGTGTLLKTDTLYGTFGDAINPDRTKYCPPGYRAPGKLVPVAPPFMTIQMDTTQNIVSVLYDNQNSITYDIFWYQDGIGGTLLGHEDGTAVLGSTIAVDRTKYAPNGYQTPGILYGSNIAEDAGQVINVVYKYKKTNISYEIHYYAEGSPDRIGRVWSSGMYGEVIPVNLNLFKPLPEKEWKDGVVEPGSAVRILEPGDAGYVDGNIVTVTYYRNDDNRFKYTVNYYQDSVDSANLVGTTDGYDYVGTDVTSSIDRTMHRPTGYVGLGEISGNTIITSVEANNVINVTYKTKGVYAYQVYYWQDAKGGKLLKYIGGAGVEGLFGDPIPVSHEWCPAGYDSSKAEYIGPTTIGVSGNTLDVVYSTVNSYRYQIYYITGDQPSLDKVYYIEEGTKPLNTVVTPTFNSTTVPPGYSTVGVIEMNTPWIIKANETDNVWYVMFPNKTNLTVTVNYYKDEVTTPSDTAHFINSVVINGTVGQLFSELVANGTIDLNKYKPGGYRNGAQAGPQDKVQEPPTATVFNVLYSASTTNFSYKVVYRIFENNQYVVKGEQLGSGLYGQEIVADPAKIAQFKPDGYQLEGDKEGNWTISDVEANNIAYYTYKPNALVPITVKYYSNFEDDFAYLGNPIWGLGTAYSDLVINQLVGTKVNLTAEQLNKYRELPGPDFSEGKQIPADYVVVAANNEVHVVYYDKQSTKASVMLYWKICPNKDKSNAKDYHPAEFGANPILSDWDIGTTVPASEYIKKWGQAGNPDLKNLFEVDPQRQIVLDADHTKNIITFYYDEVPNHVGVYAYNTAFGLTEIVEEGKDTIVDANGKINVKETVDETLEAPTFTLIAAPVRVNDEEAILIDEVADNVTEEAIAGIAQDTAEALVAESEADKVVITELTYEELEDYTFAAGYDYALIVNYHSGNESSLVTDALDALSTDMVVAETAVLNDSAQKVNDSVVTNNDGDRAAAHNKEDEGNTDDNGHHQDIEPEPEGDIVE